MKKLLFDFFPIIIFFVMYKIYDIYTATIALIIATAIQLSYETIRYKKVSMMHVVTFILVLTLGSATVYFHDETLIKWKVTIVNWLFGMIFIFSTYLMQKPIIQRLMEENIELPEKIWKRLNNIWGIFFLFLGTVNLFVAYTFSTDIWVDFKLFGMLGITLIFVIGQGIFLAKHVDHK
ncbi:septation protein A [Fastidiosibacter lacustris]|uniref:septation protein A n=1 Tax=Fastidiosibacter lacustris TaxID=2056695 RepID=UPI000E347A48|nr:septation protein A [Fastidiosibacter lacustris]